MPKKPPERHQLTGPHRAVARIAHGLERVPTHYAREGKGKFTFWIGDRVLKKGSKPLFDAKIHKLDDARLAASMKAVLELPERPHFYLESGERIHLFGAGGQPLGEHPWGDEGKERFKEWLKALQSGDTSAG